MNRKGTFSIELGILLIMIAMGLVIYNYWDAHRADQASNHLVEMIHQEMPDEDDISFSETWTNPYLEQDETDIPEMPTVEIENNLYIGTLTIPQLGLELPVMADWDYEKLKLSPCRYSGSYYTDDLVIAGHNYARHFSRIKWIEQNEDIYFTNVEGKTWHYTVLENETLQPKQVDEMTTGEWNLTLFTCTTGGQSRCAVRCVKVEE